MVVGGGIKEGKVEGKREWLDDAERTPNVAPSRSARTGVLDLTKRTERGTRKNSLD